MRIKTGDITSLKDVEVIVNAANGRGPMGRGVARAIADAGGEKLTNEVKKICKEKGGFKEGECYISSSGDLSKNKVKNIYHAVTMEYPGGPTSLNIVSTVMRAVLNEAIKNGVKSIAFPGLGTGIGGLNIKQVAHTMVSIAELFEDKIDITIVDIDKDFIQHAKDAVKIET